MDPFKEIHLASLLQKPLFGPTALPAVRAFELATLGGAKVLGLENELGSLEVGKTADVVTVDRSHPSVFTVDNPYSALVYSCSGRDVVNVMTNGRWTVKEKEHLFFEPNKVRTEAISETRRLAKNI